MLDEGVYPHASALARGEGITAAAVSRGLQKLRGEEPRRRTAKLPITVVEEPGVGASAATPAG